MDGPFAFFLAICVLFGIGGGLQGRSKGSSFLLWFFIAACLPLFGYIASVVYPGHRYEQRRQCDTCGRLLPITDTMCMSCGTDLGFPEVRYLPEAVNEAALDHEAAAGAVASADDAPDADGGEAENPYERAAESADEGAATPSTGAGAR
ncbi:hypothetical protein [Patulibacter minatonensis]|uniref:hypothetical protein n=1 Tax=Patulibacter minatonensis TaxID=298163 RepID=UPI0004B95ACA|nr:hypothetical protein [Patulibacter minatonensis]